ncbi:site-2 protease family protein [Mangrovibacillus cuniculi]|uniref:Site-2 protease family protein n=1 Tax=Mangrovibacillus cuniculi TaxID=2593652 RepID=A0A7S8HHF5_9BACI|nr:site-2 protease family protein [Mangrovibacillus cuniculi]
MEFLDRFLAFQVEDLPFIVVSLVIAFTVHEFAHAYVAYKFGDDTAAKQGRLTLNPVQHLDPLGTLLILLFGFGWARPVPVNRFKFSKPRLAGVMVSVAGPLSNFLLAFIGFVLLFLMFQVNTSGSMQFLIDFLDRFVFINLLLFVFNLLPFPPLDGFRIIQDLVPSSVRPKLTKLEPFGALFFLFVVLTPLSGYIIEPIFFTFIPLFQQFFTMLLSVFV